MKKKQKLNQNQKLDVYQKLTQSAKRRLKIIKGQLDGLERMILADEYCVDILTQSASIQASLKSLDQLVLERHLKAHVKNQFKHEPQKAIKELLKVFKQSKK